MKKPVLQSNLIYLLSLVLLMLQSCNLDANAIKGNGDISVEEKSLQEFQVIQASGMFKIHLSDGDVPGIRIEADENILPYISSEVKSGTLHLRMERDQTYRPTQLDIYITTTNISHISLAGATSLSADYTLSSENLILDLSGASDLRLTLNVENLETRVSGAGNIVFDGTAYSHKIELSGAASIKCNELKTYHTSVRLSGAGSAEVNARETLDASISGVGSIKYSGNPKQTHINKSGLGSIRPA